MSVIIPCPGCGVQTQVSQQLAGYSITCPRCQTIFDIPADLTNIDPRNLRIRKMHHTGPSQGATPADARLGNTGYATATPAPEPTPTVYPAPAPGPLDNVDLHTALGYGSLGLGGVCFLFSFIPFLNYLGLLFSGIGFFLGIAGVGMAYKMDKTKLPFSIGGIAVNFVAFLLSLLFIFVVYK